MFKISDKDRQLDAFANIPTMLEDSASKIFNDQNHWHNQFRNHVVMPLDETIFSVLFSNSMGAPNSSIRLLTGMMILKEAFGWSDLQLFEQCQFNLLTRSALGLININDSIPAPSTYYLLRKRIHEHGLQTGENLIEKVFANITRQQVKKFEVNGQSIRMDSKLFGSNIALYSRYEIIHQTLCRFYEKLDDSLKERLSATDREQMNELKKEDPQKTIYRSNREEIKGRLQPIGILTYKLLQLYNDLETKSFQLLQRVFNEQYKVLEDQQVELRPKDEITSSSIQSPHDPDCAFRNKGDQKVKGYSANITETCSETGLNLITSVIVETANTPDTTFVKPAIEATKEITGQPIEKINADGAYQSPDNDEFCKGIDMVYTGIQGAEPRYDLKITPEGLLVTDTLTGEQQIAGLVKKTKNSKGDRYRITTETGYCYFGQQAIRASLMRKIMKERPVEETRKRNNVEATVFQYGFQLKNKKSKYRGLINQKTWSFCRCLWINLVRIMNYLEQIYQRTNKNHQNPVFLNYFALLLKMTNHIIPKAISITNRIFTKFEFLYQFRFYRLV